MWWSIILAWVPPEKNDVIKSCISLKKQNNKTKSKKQAKPQMDNKLITYDKIQGGFISLVCRELFNIFQNDERILQS